MIHFSQDAPSSLKTTGYEFVDSNISLNIVNLSSHTLSTHETDVLMKGLGFCPNENFNKFDLIWDLHLFIRKL